MTALDRTARWDMGSRMLWRDFLRMLTAKRTTDACRESYTYAAASLMDHAAAPLDQVTRDQVTAWLADLARRFKPATSDTYYRRMRRFYLWAEQNDMLPGRTPFAGTEPPQLDEPLIPVVDDATTARVLAACKGKKWRDRRDAAIIRLLRSTGLRAGELCGLTLADVDMIGDVLTVERGKWARGRLVSFPPDTGLALSAALRARPAAAPSGPDAPFFVGCVRGKWGPLTTSGVRQIVQDRCDLAGVPRVHPHQFRHTCVDEAMYGGMTERDALLVFGWKRREMVSRYGAAAAARGAVDHMRAMNLGAAV